MAYNDNANIAAMSNGQITSQVVMLQFGLLGKPGMIKELTQY